MAPLGWVLTDNNVPSVVKPAAAKMDATVELDVINNSENSVNVQIQVTPGEGKNGNKDSYDYGNGGRIMQSNGRK